MPKPCPSTPTWSQHDWRMRNLCLCPLTACAAARGTLSLNFVMSADQSSVGRMHIQQERPSEHLQPRQVGFQAPTLHVLQDAFLDSPLLDARSSIHPLESSGCVRHAHILSGFQLLFMPTPLRGIRGLHQGSRRSSGGAAGRATRHSHSKSASFREGPPHSSLNLVLRSCHPRGRLSWKT